jgi:hypothetical protein
MKKLLVLCTLFAACKKSSTTDSGSNAQVKYEVKVSGVTSWSGNYLDATDAATLLQGETSSDWTVTFTNQIPSERYLQIQVISVTPIDELSPVTAITTIYVNGNMVKSDTASGYAGEIILPLAEYLLQ